jgi:hypothetical protein
MDFFGSNSSPKTRRWAWVAVIVLSISALTLHAWRWTHEPSRWSGFFLPTGMLVLGIVSFFDYRRGVLYKVGSILALVLMLIGIFVLLIGWVVN